jgi:hypothetical protein
MQVARTRIGRHVAYSARRQVILSPCL